MTAINSGMQKKIAVILQYLQMALNVALSLAYTPLMLRILGAQQYGIYSSANSMISCLSLLSLGFGASYIRFYSRYKSRDDADGIKKLNGLFLEVFLAMGAAALVCGLLLSRNAAFFFNASYSESDLRTAQALMVYLSLNLALSFPNSVFNAYVTAQEMFVFQKVLSILRTVCSPLLSLPALLLGYGSVGMVIITTLVSGAADAINLFFCIRKLKMPFRFGAIDPALLKEIGAFSFFIALNQIVDQVNWTTDKIILGKLCSGSSVAVYAIGSQINTCYLQFSTAISGVFIPQVNRIAASRQSEREKSEALTKLLTKVGRVQFEVLMLILSGFVFFGKYFIRIWAGKGYENSYSVALLLIIPISVPLIQNVCIEIQRAENKHQFRSCVYMLMAVLNVVISIFFAKRWGEIGAALGTAVSLILANGIIMNIFYQKKLGLDILFFWREILSLVPALAPPAAAGILLNLWPCTSAADFVLRAAAFTVIYNASVYFWGMNPFEKQQAEKLLRRFQELLKQSGSGA